MVFHDISNYLYKWMDEQPHVKEESLTDWMLYEISRMARNIKYLSFNRREEAANGADWEWWALTRDSAYRFSVQAKKLKGAGQDNWPAIIYSNKHAAQIDLLLNVSAGKGSYPLYLFYSIQEPEMENQLNSFNHPVLRKMIQWCKDCVKGVFISPAFLVADLINNNKRFHLVDEKLLDISLSLTTLDWFKSEWDLLEDRLGVIEELLAEFNQRNIKSEEMRGYYYGNSGFRYYYQDSRYLNRRLIPDYLQNIISQGAVPKWLSIDRPEDLPDVDGIVLIDLRYDEE